MKYERFEASGRKYRPKLTAVATDNILDRVYAFMEVRNIVDPFPEEVMKERKYAFVVKNRERFWATEFTDVI